MIVKPVEIPDGFVSTITPVLGHEVHALEGGSKNGMPPIVMIHGALASRRYLLPTATLLAMSMRVFVPEMPGHGASSKPEHALSVQQQAEVFSQWFKLNGLTQAHIFANSYGCQVAVQLLVSNPQIASSLILADPTVDPSARTLIQEAFRLYIDGFFEPQGAQGQLVADLSDMGIKRVFETGQQMIRDDIRPKLEKIKCPALVLRGEKDPISPQRWTKEVANRLPNAQFRVIPNAPHCVNYATPAQLAYFITEFINKSTSITT